MTTVWFDHEAEWRTRQQRIDPRLRADGWVLELHPLGGVQDLSVDWPNELLAGFGRAVQ